MYYVRYLEVNKKEIFQSIFDEIDSSRPTKTICCIKRVMGFDVWPLGMNVRVSIFPAVVKNEISITKARNVKNKYFKSSNL